MKKLTFEETRNLINKQSAPCISIYVPLMGEPTLALGQHLKDAEALLKKNYSTALTRALLEPLQEFKKFPKGKGTLCLFRALGIEGYTFIPHDYHHLMVVANSFHLKPLLETLQHQNDYYVLALNPYAVDLYKGNPLGFERVWTLPNLDALEKGATNLLSLEKGRAEWAVDGFTKRMSFFLDVNEKVRTTIEGTSPLFLYAAKKEAQLYRSLNTYPELSQYRIPREAFLRSKDSLEAHASALMARVREQIAEKQKNILHLMSHKVVSGLEKIVDLVAARRAQAIYVSKDHMLFGKIDWDTRRASLHGQQKDAWDDDVLDDLSEKAISKKIPVYVVEGDTIPNGKAAVALPFPLPLGNKVAEIPGAFPPSFWGGFGVAAISVARRSLH